MRPTRIALPALVAIVALALTGCVADPLSQSARSVVATLEALEGDARTDAALAYMSTAESAALQTVGADESVAAELRDPLAPPTEFTFTPASYENTGVATFVGLGIAIIGMMGDNAMTLADQGNIGSDSKPTMGGDAEITITQDGVGSKISSQHDLDGSSASMSAETQLNYCPDANGEVELTGKTDVRLAITGYDISYQIDVVATARIDDTATLVESDYTYRYQVAMAKGGAKGEFFDHSSGHTLGVTVNRESSNISNEFAQQAVDGGAAAANMIALDMLELAQRGWESGRCVNLTVTPSEDPGSIEPNAEVTLEAAPTATSDGHPTEGTVSATLSGEGSLDPSGSKQDAPATFTYTAADEKNLTGTVSVESRSKRGFGKATIDLSTGSESYSAVGTQGDYSASGTICSLTSTFTLSGTGLTFTFTPVDKFDGTYRVTGMVEGVTFTGDGEYTVTRSKDVATNLIVKGEMVLTTPEGITATSPADIDFVLTPIEACD